MAHFVYLFHVVHFSIQLSAEKLEVVVSTPGVLVGVIRKGLLDLSLVRQVVVDEADTLLDDSFRELVTEILHKIQVRLQKYRLKSKRLE